MTLGQHLIQGAVISPALVPFWGVENSAIFFCSFILIDVDHYLLYLMKTGDSSIKAMFRFCRLFPKRYKGRMLSYCIFHSLEALFLLTLAGFYLSDIFFIILFGFLSHILLDMYNLYRYNAFFDRVYSIPEYLIRKRTGKYVTNLPNFRKIHDR